ncbi:MAG TPA: DUF4349 domain-containing protein [Ktedonobacteraceae bacterium]|nr:DUF4349 domain-containing protein [Ktedonobacteraceae bacterium]
MSQRRNRDFFRKHPKKYIYAFIGLCVGGILLVGCGASSSVASNASVRSAAHAPFQDAGSNTGSQSSAQGKDQAQASATVNTAAGLKNGAGPQYLQKSLQVAIEVQDTRATASDLQQWVGAAVPQSTSAGIDYEQVGDNQYSVTLTLLVDVAHYDQVKNYLRDYAGQRGRRLLNMRENVQDVTNDYIDTQTRLTDLRAEQQRLLGFLNQAQNLSDTLSVEQQLTQVEGQINQIEAHLNALKGQTSFYTVTIALQPVGSVPPPEPASPWSVIPVWQGAWSAVVGVWQMVVTLLVWLLAFSVYIIPPGIIIWLAKRWRWHRAPRVVPVIPVGETSDPQPK